MHELDREFTVETKLKPEKQIMKTSIIKTACNLKLTPLAAFLSAVLFITGCASTSVTDQQEFVTGPIPKPAQIWVYDFAATAADVPAESRLAGQTAEHPAPQTAEQIAEGQKLGAQIASELVAQIHAMGMPAQVASAGIQPQINDLVIRGYFLSIYEGSAAKRVAIGFGAGASDLKTVVEGFQMTANGLRKIGSGDLNAGGDKTPGSAVGLAGLIATANPAGLIVSGGMKVYGEESGSSTVEGRAKQTAKEIADQLKTRFQQQGWIN
jgi:hypothetical protein